MNEKYNAIYRLYAGWTDGPKYTLLHSQSDIDLVAHATKHSKVTFGSPEELLAWIKSFDYKIGTIFVDVATELWQSMVELRPKLDIRHINLG